MNIVIGIPAYNEEKNIASIILKLKKITDKIIVCNDGSTDLTGEIASKLGAIVVNHEKNLGYGSAIRSLFQKAKEIDAEILVTFDADGQHRTSDINTVVEPILKDQADIVIGSRFLDKDNTVPEYRKFGIKVSFVRYILSSSNKSSNIFRNFLFPFIFLILSLTSLFLKCEIKLIGSASG